MRFINGLESDCRGLGILPNLKILVEACGVALCPNLSNFAQSLADELGSRHFCELGGGTGNNETNDTCQTEPKVSVFV